MKHKEHIQGKETMSYISTTILTALMLFVAMGVKAADYVLTYTNGGTTYYLARNGTTGVQRVTTFNPTTCIWSCASNTAGTTAGTLNNSNTYGYLYQTVSGTKYFLNASANALGLGTNAAANNYYRWRTNGTYVYNRYSGTYSYYINLASGVARNTTANTGSNARPYEVTTANIAQNVTSSTTITQPSISPSSSVTINNGASQTFTASGSTATTTTNTVPAHTTYTFNGTTLYYYNNTVYTSTAGFSTSTTTNPTVSYSWSLADGTLTDGHVNIDASTGILNCNTPYDEENHSVTIMLTASAGGQSATATKTITVHDTRTLANPASITANNVEITAGESMEYTDYTLTTANPATQRPYRYVSASSSDPSIATVTNSGGTFTVNGVNEGTATITITAYNTNNTASSVTTTFIVTVLPPTTGIANGIVTLNDYEDHNWTYYSGVDSSVDGGNYNTNYAGKMYSPDPRNVKITYKANGGAVSIDESETEFVYYKTIEKVNGAYTYTVISNPFSKRPNGKGFGGWKIKEGAEYISGYADEATLPLDAELTLTGLDNNYTANCTSAEIELEATWVNYNNLTYAPGNTFTYSVTGGTYETNFLVLNRNVTGTITVSSPCTIIMVEPDGSSDYRNTNAFTGNITPNNNGVTKIEWAKWNSTATVNAVGRNMTIGRGVTNSQGGWDLRGNASNNTTMNQVFKIESGKAQTLHGFSNSPSSVTKQQIILGCDYDRASGNNNNMEVTGYVCYASATPVKATSGDNISFLIKSGKYLNNAGNGSAGTSTYCMYMWYNGGGGSGSRSLTIEGGEIRHIAGGYDNGNNQDDVNLRIRVKGGIIRGVVFGGAAKQNTYGGKCLVFTGGTVEGWIAGASNGFEEANNGTVEGATYVYVGGKTIVGTNNSVVTNASTGGNIYGAGCGRSAENTSGRATKGTNIVFGDQAYVRSGVYGGGAYGYCPEDQTANVYITGGTVEGIYDTTYKVNGGVYGGARQNRGGTVNLYMTDGQVNSGVYGGSNAIGTISGNVTMSINGGQVGTTTQNANIHGGGYGQATSVAGNVSLTLGTDGQATQGVTVYGDVYGGSALGTVNTNTSNTTTVNLYKGNIYGNAYGGGLGDESTAAIVNGNVAVNLNGAAFGKATIKDDQGNDIVSKGRVFGCNNVNGTPKGTVTVHVYKTAGINGAAKPARNTDVYEVQAVYGGGNLAAYQPTASNTATKVIIDGCGLSSIAYVYGGGNAAPVPATDVTVNGSYEIDYVFGGGNGKDRIQSSGTWEENPGADVGKVNGVSYGTTDPIGTTTTTIYGGVIHHVFGGSNTKGDVTKEANVILGDQNLQTCEFKVDEVYGAGNEAYMSGNANITLNCIEGLTEIYGGSRMADIGSSSERKDVNLTIHGGRYTNVFGGNNLSGRIYGKINVTIQEDGCLPIEIDHLYLGGNKALYSVFGYNDDAGKTPKTSGTSYGDPELYIISATRIGEVYGGGYGEDAIMYGNPHININMEPGEVNGEYVYISSNTEHPDAVSPTEYANYDKTKNTTDTFPLKLSLGNIGTVFGGGNAAKVVGDTYIQIGTGTTIDGAVLTRQDAQISGNVYGGGNQAEVTGKTNVVIGHE